MDGRRAVVRRRLQLAGLVVAFVVVGWTAKLAADANLADGRVVDLGLIQLRLVHNSGVAFSFGAGLPSSAIVLLTGGITVAVAVYGWRAVGELAPWGLVGLAGIVAGAATNVVDRAADGVVTDYLHTSWFATFNVPDSLIVGGAVLVVAATLFAPAPTPAVRQEPGS